MFCDCSKVLCSPVPHKPWVVPPQELPEQQWDTSSLPARLTTPITTRPATPTDVTVWDTINDDSWEESEGEESHSPTDTPPRGPTDTPPRGPVWPHDFTTGMLYLNYTDVSIIPMYNNYNYTDVKYIYYLYL